MSIMIHQGEIAPNASLNNLTRKLKTSSLNISASTVFLVKMHSSERTLKKVPALIIYPQVMYRRLSSILAAFLLMFFYSPSKQHSLGNAPYEQLFFKEMPRIETLTMYRDFYLFMLFNQVYNMIFQFQELRRYDFLTF